MNRRIPITIGLLFLALFIWLSLTTNPGVRYVISRIDNIFYDVQLRLHVWHHPVNLQAQSQIAIVDVDDQSLKTLGRWPWPRSLLAKIVDELKHQGAIIVATDMMFSEPDTNIVGTIIDTLNTRQLMTPALSDTLNKLIPDFEQDGIFAKSLQSIDSVLGMVFLPSNQEEGQLPPPSLLLSPAQAKDLSLIQAAGYISNVPVLENAVKSTGFLNVYPDGDGVIRRAPIIIRYKDGVYSALALEAVRRFLLMTKLELVTPYYDKTMRLEGVNLGNYFIPTDESGQALVPFVGKSFSFPYISARTVLEGKTPPQFFQGKIVFIGTSATGEGDIKATAIEKVFPGVEIQASIANGILTHYFPYKPAWAAGAELVFTIVIGLLAAIIFPYLGPLLVSGLTICIPLLFALILYAEETLWNSTGFIFSTFIPITLLLVLSIFNIIYGYLFEARKRKRLKNIFGQYVPRKHIEEMLKAKGNYGMLGDDRDMTVLFADIRSFTTISEGMNAANLKEMLNAFFTPMTEVIFKHKGTIDKYVGDLIMAFWGAPLKDKRHAYHAIAAALEMQETIRKLEPEINARGWPNIQMGIGLNSGIMSVGDMGSKFRRNYTVLGDEVNLASRVESLTKFYGVNIMATEHTSKELSAFVFRQLDRVRVKGKQTGIDIFEVITHSKDLSEALTQELEEHHRALLHYFEQRFTDAEALFMSLHQSHPETKIYKIYLERLESFKTNPPPSDWDGIYTHATK